MQKPTFFKFFDNYVELFRACETHKDRSILLLAMFDYWDNGTNPELPKRLQDKWRFLYLSLKTSRKNAYAALERNGGNDEEKSSETVESSSSFQPKTQNNRSDNQQVNKNVCAQTAHDVSTYRIKNKEEKNIENDNDRSIGDSDRSMGSISDFPDEWDEVMDMLHSQPDDDEFYHNPSAYTNPSPSPSSNPSSNPNPESSSNSYPNPSPKSCFCSCSNQSTTQSNQPESQFKPESLTNTELDEVGARILERIVSLYKEHKRAVSYTHATAERELGVAKVQFYQAIKHLEATDQLHKEKVPMQDGKVVNYYTPAKVTSLPSKKVLPHFHSPEGSPFVFHVVHYFMEHPFLYDPSWDKEQFLANNKIQLEVACQELSNICSNSQKIMDFLWYTTNKAQKLGKLYDA